MSRVKQGRGDGAVGADPLTADAVNLPDLCQGDAAEKLDLDGGIELLGLADMAGVEAADDHPPLHAALLDGGDDFVDHGGGVALDLDDHTDAIGGAEGQVQGLGQGGNLFSRKEGAEPGAGIEAAQLIIGHGRDRPAGAGGARDRLVMHQHEGIVLGEPDVQFEPVGADLDGPGE
ncbi:MAG: hypothetical protein BWY77_00911 [bacterium ADurb.Bin431]|nr:MAG: hypothetical protein BWY77_00911 [bacterium ADurb.Bin431]